MLLAFADVSILQLVLVAGMALVASLVGGVAGYGTGALMPLVLVPMLGAEAVVPILAMSALLTGRGAQLVIGGMLMLTVPLRLLLKRRAVTLGDRGLALGSVGYGAAVGGTVGAGVILLSLLMAAGLEGAAVIATDALVSIFIGLARIAVFGSAGVITAQTVAFALLIGLVAFPGVFLAKAFVVRLPIHVHTAILDAVVLVGGAVMVFGAFGGL